MRCSKCGADSPDSKRFCGDCGTALTGADEGSLSRAPDSDRPSLRPSPATEGERKTVTALFADIKGSTQIMRDLDPEDARAIIDPAIQLMIKAVHRYDGYVVQSTGDGILAVFGAPVAHEDHPQRALHAALATFEELRRAEELQARGGDGVAVRIGINTGEVVMRLVQTGGHTEYSPIGHAINLAKRVEGAAPAGSIAVSDETRRLVEGYFELRALGPTEVKGLEEAIDVYEVVGVGALHDHFDVAAQRGLTKFVGRENELAQMRRALELAVDGKGQVVSVVAEAGTGKSRLFYEFKATLPKECKLLEAYSVSHGRATAWLPVLELLRRYFNLTAADDAKARREKVHTTLVALDPALEDTLPYLFGLLGIVEGADPLAQMDPQIKRQRTLEAIKRIVIRESLNQPVVVIFEDLHWIDSQTQALLDLLADSIANARVLLLTNYRPEYLHQWSSKTYYSQLRLDPLAGEDGAAMLAALLDTSPAPATSSQGASRERSFGAIDGAERVRAAAGIHELKRLIIERTGGNPFFIEEMVRVLFDEGALVRNGVVKVTRSLSQLRLPPTVQGILAARIDRLSPDNKELLQTLSVLGRESSLALISQVTTLDRAGNGGREKHLGPMLAELRASEFIYEQAATSGSEYVFKHALTQEVAYNSLLIERRKQLHERAGLALESIFAEQLDDHLSQLAHHYSHSDNTDKAIDYLGRAGQQAIQRSAHADAVNNLTTAIALLQRLPEGAERIPRELPLQLALGQASIVLKGWAAQEVERAFTRAREICTSLGDPPETFFVLMGLAAMYHVRGDNRPGREILRQLLERAQITGNPTHMLLVHFGAAQGFLHTGELLLAREHQSSCLSLYDQKRDGPLAYVVGSDPKTSVLSYAGWTLWNLGYPDQAVEMNDEGIAAAHAVHHTNSIGAAELFMLVVRLLRREPRLVQEGAENLIAFSSEHGLGAFSLFASFYLGWAIAQQGQEEGIERMRQSLAIAHAAGADIGRSHYLNSLAEACAKSGRVEEALSALTEALAVANEREERVSEAETHRLLGELLLKQHPSNAEEAGISFKRAISIARNQSAKSFELRATTSLARLLASQGRRDEARTMLAEIYNWFTEGFDTADLIDAKALLDDLSN